MKKTKFTQGDFSFICPMKWESMQVAANGRFCDKCEQTVVDVSDCSLDEVASLQNKNPAICVAIKTLVTTGVALSIAACSSTPSPASIHVTAGVPRQLPQNTQTGNQKTEAEKKRQVLSEKLLKSKAHCQLPQPQKSDTK